ncbi:MAG TPA: DinB family protein [Candidatus Limnocylindrales bacterium]|jgi:hypothetical protein|nr:DinB family protein [Candidatus Limnocylindrales bacterium]
MRDPVRLLALARALEARGIYNGGKLLRGLLEQELISAAGQRAGASDEALASDLEALAPALGRSYGDRFAAALMAAARAVRESSVLPLAEAPAVFTCRGCGTIALDGPPAACPRCHSHALTFHEHLPIWFLEPMEPETTLAALEAGPGAATMLVAERDDDALTTRPDPEEWSARDVLEHLVAAEELLALRVKRLLQEDEPDLAAQATWAATPRGDETAPGGEPAPASALLERYRDLRGETLDLLRACSPEQWGRRGHHAEWGVVTLAGQAAYFCRHEASHLGQLAGAITATASG